MRGKGEGSIRQRADGRWEARITIGRNSRGRQRRKAIYGKTQGEVIAKMKKVGTKPPHATSSPTVAAYLKDWYDTNKDEWSFKTQECYATAINRRLSPVFGHLRMEKLTPLVIQTWLKDCKAEHGGTLRRNETLAHAVLRSALTAAAGLEIVDSNAAKSVKVHHPKKREIVTLDAEQAALFWAAALKHRLAALFLITLTTGLRLGEVLGLMWKDAINFETNQITIKRQLQEITGDPGWVLVDVKTKKSQRTLSVPAACMTVLQEHRRLQLEERLRAGKQWVDTGLAFTTYGSFSQPTATRDAIRMRTVRAQRRGAREKATTAGNPLSRRNLRRALDRIVTDAAVPRIRFHELRHSAASILIAAGVSLEEVSMLLGHSQLSITQDLYVHLQKATAAKAATHMETLFGSGVR